METKYYFFTTEMNSIGGVERTASEFNKYCINKKLDITILTLFKSGSEFFLAERGWGFNFFKNILSGPLAFFIFGFYYLREKKIFSCESNVKKIVFIRSAPLNLACILFKKVYREEFSIIFIPSHYSFDFYFPIIRNKCAKRNYFSAFKTFLNAISERLIEMFIYRDNSCFSTVFFSHNLENRIGDKFSQFDNKFCKVVRPGTCIRELDFSKSKIESKIVNLTYVGRVEPGKNIDLLLDYFSKYNRKNVYLNVIGDGSLLNELKSKYHLNVNFLGVLNSMDIQSELLTSNYLILPTFNESFGHVIAESLSCGTPVIGFSFDGTFNAIPELIIEHENGFIIKSSSYNDFKTVIDEAVSVADDFISRRTSISKKYQSIFNWENFFSEVIFSESKI